MNDEATKIRSEALAAIAAASDAAALDAVRVGALGKKGSVTELMKSLGKLPVEQRKDAGAALNTLKTELSVAIDARAAALAGSALESRLATERVDVTLPVRPMADGRIHPISQTMDEIVAIFGEMGFAVAEGPDIEDDFHNFTALNIPPEHPARQMPRHVLYEERGRPGAQAAAHAHIAGADPHHDVAEAADPHHRAGAHLPRRLRRDAYAEFPSGRRPGDRQDDAYGPSQGLPDRVRARVLRRGRPAGALSAELFPVHRSRRRKSISAAAARAAS